jgi:putative SOS response-associated peptidase YedK
MCGRYVSVKSRADLQTLYDVTRPSDVEIPASWNVAPTQQVYGVLERTEKDGPAVERQLRALRWGLVPSWAKDQKIGSRLINARAETLADKSSFRAAFAKRRAILPAAGYFEWQPVDCDGKVRKQPYFIHPADGGVLSFAGLYELWPDPAKDKDDPDRWIWSATIITTDATDPAASEVHDRTPLILPSDRIDAWLNPELTDAAQVQKLLTGIEMPALEVRPVSTEVNKVAINKPDLIEPLEDEVDRPLALALT